MLDAELNRKPLVLSAEHIVQEYKDCAFEKASNTGWNWKCPAAVVETAAPWLPAFLQAAFNSSNYIAGQVTEMELAMSMAMTYSRTHNLEECGQDCQADSPLTMLLGEELFTAIVRTDFGKESSFPMVRCSPKQKDGFSRLLVRSDIGKMKSAGSRENLMPMMPKEKMASLLLEALQKPPKVCSTRTM